MICFSGYLCLIYGLLYGFFFSYDIVFTAGHGFTQGETGLCFVRPQFIHLYITSYADDSVILQLGILIGIFLVVTIACPLQERYYQGRVLALGGAAPPETRLPLMMGCSIVLPISLFIFVSLSVLLCISTTSSYSLHVFLVFYRVGQALLMLAGSVPPLPEFLLVSLSSAFISVPTTTSSIPTLASKFLMFLGLAF